MTPIKVINGCELWFDTDADAEGDPGYYWINRNDFYSRSTKNYHNIDDSICTMERGEVTFGGV